MNNIRHFETLTPMKAIRMKCYQCSNGSANEIKECPITGCALYKFMAGHRPDKESITDVDVRVFLDDEREVVHFTHE